MEVKHPFFFLGHGPGPATFDLWLGFASPRDSPAQAVALLEAWLGDDADGWVAAERGVIELSTRRPPGPALLQAIEGLLAQVHALSPLGLVVRTNRVKPDAWHADALAHPDAVLEVLERHVRAADASAYAPLELDVHQGESVHRAAWQALRLMSPAGAWLQATLKQLHDGAKKSRSALAVWDDLVQQRLPAWLGRDFAFDLAVQEQLTRSLGVAPGAVEMPARFTEAFARMVRASHAAAQGDDDAAPATDGPVRWASSQSIRRALREESIDWAEASRALRDTDEVHTQALLALTHAERVQLAQHPPLATKLLNVATLLLSAGAAEPALLLFEAGIEGRFPSEAAANPLYAVQDDNTHLGVRPERHERFLTRCLPHGRRNPTVFLNGAGVAMELDQPERALELLHQAKACGLNLKPYRNDRLFAPLRELPAFKKLVR